MDVQLYINERIIRCYKEVILTLMEFEKTSVIAKGLKEKMLSFNLVILLSGFTDVLSILDDLILNFQ